MVEASSDLDHTVALELVTSPTTTPAKVGRDGEGRGGGGGERVVEKGQGKRALRSLVSVDRLHTAAVVHTHLAEL